MAFDALHVERVSSRYHFRIFDVTLIVAIQAYFRLGPIFGRCLMALATGD
jgi:hypothetical protein